MIPNRSVPSASVIPVLAYLDVPDAADWGDILVDSIRR